MISKKIFVFIFLLLLALPGCKRQLEVDNYTACDYVDLCDYKDIFVKRDDVEVSQEDVDAAIRFDIQMSGHYLDVEPRPIKENDTVFLNIKVLQKNNEQQLENIQWFVIDSEDLSKEEKEINNKLIGKVPGESFISELKNEENKTIKCEIEIVEIKETIIELSDEIIRDIYHYNNLEEAREDFKTKIIERRIFDIAKETIIEQSEIIAYPKQKQEFIEKREKEIKTLALDNNTTEEKICEEIFDKSVDEYIKEVSIFFDEYLVFKAICEKENLEYDNNDFKEIESLLGEGKLSEQEEYIYYYDDVGVLYSMRYNDVRELLIKYTKII